MAMGAQTGKTSRRAGQEKGIISPALSALIALIALIPFPLRGEVVQDVTCSGVYRFPASRSCER
jgi:hypothetical protein